MVRDGAVLLVHRPKYDDWTLPKGKRDPGETDEQCAAREVAEETGVRVHVGRELLGSTYRDAKGRSKVVRYWAMTVAGHGHWEPNDEIDQVLWLELAMARDRLTYDRDRDVLTSWTG